MSVPVEITGDQAAIFLQVTKRTVNSWAAGVGLKGFPRALPKLDRNKYNLLDVIFWNYDRIRFDASPQSVTLEEAERRSAVAEAGIKEEKLARMRGEVILIDDAARILADYLVSLRSETLNIPDKVAARLLDLLKQAIAEVGVPVNINSPVLEPVNTVAKMKKVIESVIHARAEQMAAIPARLRALSAQKTAEDDDGDDAGETNKPVKEGSGR